MRADVQHWEMDEQAVDVLVFAGKFVAALEVDVVAKVSPWVYTQIRREVFLYCFLQLLHIKFSVDRVV